MALDVNDNPAAAADGAEASDWDDRRLCSDENCIGVIGPDGRCKECGKPDAGAAAPRSMIPGVLGASASSRYLEARDDARRRQARLRHVMTTILLADDHLLVRQGLAALLGAQDGWEVVAEAGDGAEAVRFAGALKPRVAILDVEMPRMGGIEAARAIRRVSPNTLVVALSMYSDLHYLERMREAGASGYVLKNEAFEDLIDAIHAVLRGVPFVSSAALRRDPAAGLRSAKLDQELLSDREREVLRLLAEGKRTKEIAESLAVSPKTIETYRLRLTKKLGIDNVPELVRFAIRAGLVSPGR
jgi:DNA-binding NarL/FixJ family response regulator